jgi:hypothetical protein
MLQEEYEELKKILGATLVGARIFPCDRRECNERNDAGIYRESV